MLSFIVRLVSSFEKRHGIRPNLLYMNRTHSEHLKAAFGNRYSFGQIMEFLQIDIIIDSEVMHPHAAWTQMAQRVAS